MISYKIEKGHLEPLLKARPLSAATLVELLSRRQEATQAMADTPEGVTIGPADSEGGYADQMLGRIRHFFQL